MEAIERYIGCMSGLAIGDAMGAPVEGLKSGHIRQLYPKFTTYPDPAVAWRKKPRRWSAPALYRSDTQQAMAMADTLVKCRGFEPGYFVRLMTDMLGADTGGGLGAHRGAGPNFRSALRSLGGGAGPEGAGLPSAGVGAMPRAVPGGLYFSDDPRATALAAIDAGVITHRDPRALVMAAVIAGATRLSASGEWDGSSARSRASDMVELCREAESLVERNYIHLVPVECMDRFGLALSAVEMLPRLIELPDRSMAFRQLLGEANRQFPRHKITESGQSFVMASGMSALFMVAVGEDFRDALLETIMIGKDTNTMAALVGGALGARLGVAAIPEEWRKGLVNAEQVALRGEALFARSAEGLAAKDLAAMESALTREEVESREDFIRRMEEKGTTAKPKKKKTKPEPEKKPDKDDLKAKPPPIDRKKKKQKRKRVKAPWKE